MLAGHEAHRLDVFCLALGQLFLERLELGVEQVDVAVDVGDVGLDAFYLLLAVVNLVVDDHEVFKPFLHVGLIGTQGFLLLLDVLLYLRPLALQSLDGLVGIDGLLLGLAFLYGLALLRLLLHRLACLLGNGLAALGGRLARLCGGRLTGVGGLLLGRKTDHKERGE